MLVIESKACFGCDRTRKKGDGDILVGNVSFPSSLFLQNVFLLSAKSYGKYFLDILQFRIKEINLGFFFRPLSKIAWIV